MGLRACYMLTDFTDKAIGISLALINRGIFALFSRFHIAKSMADLAGNSNVKQKGGDKSGFYLENG